MSTASRVAREKREHPDRFCSHPGCLWRVKHLRGGDDTPCPKHMRQADGKFASLLTTYAIAKDDEVQS